MATSNSPASPSETSHIEQTRRSAFTSATTPTTSSTIWMATSASPCQPIHDPSCFANWTRHCPCSGSSTLRNNPTAYRRRHATCAPISAGDSGRRSADVQEAHGRDRSVAKGFRRRDTHHAYLHYYTESGEKAPVWTKTSHGRPGADIGRRLLSRMARQCKLTTDEFRDLVNCPMSREAYEQAVARLRVDLNPAPAAR